MDFHASSSDTGPLVPFAEWPRPLAFVLSGAGAFGSVQVGMLEALHAAGVRPDLVVGTSAGALNGAMVAADPASASARLRPLWASADRSTTFGVGTAQALIRMLGRRPSLARPDHLRSLIDRHLPAGTFEDLVLPFGAVATDLSTGEPAVLRSGALGPALMASSAVPGLFPAVDLDGLVFVDGGVSANVPIRQAFALGARSAVVLDATPALAATGRAASSVPGAWMQAMGLMVRNQRAHAVDELMSRFPVATLPSVTPSDLGTFNFDRNVELMDLSRRATARHLAELVSSPVVEGPGHHVSD